MVWGLEVSKRSCKRLLLQRIGIYFHFAKKESDLNDNVESFQRLEMVKAVRKLYCKNENGYRATTRWKMASIRNICFTDFTSGSTLEPQYKIFNSLFGNKVARKALKTFVKFSCTFHYKASPLSVIIFNAIITDVIDSVVHNLRLTAENHAQLLVSGHIWNDDILKLNCAHKRGETI